MGDVPAAGRLLRTIELYHSYCDEYAQVSAAAAARPGGSRVVKWHSAQRLPHACALAAVEEEEEEEEEEDIVDLTGIGSPEPQALAAGPEPSAQVRWGVAASARCERCAGMPPFRAAMHLYLPRAAVQRGRRPARGLPGAAPPGSTPSAGRGCRRHHTPRRRQPVQRAAAWRQHPAAAGRAPGAAHHLRWGEAVGSGRSGRPHH